MPNAATITTEKELADVLARCGFDTDPPHLSPVLGPWEWEWRPNAIPLSRYLRGFPGADFFVAVKDGAFQVYEMHQQDHWFRLNGELRGDVSEQELAAMIRRAIYGETSQ
jgi:hypothetical protein